MINGLSVLNCRITTGDEDASNRLNILNPQYFNEVVEIEINDSYKNIVNTATITFTRQLRMRASLLDENGMREVSIMGRENSLFRKGQRIRVELCYGGDDKLVVMFEGYIVSLIPNNPFSLTCEDMGYLLKRNSVKAVTTSAKGTKINDFAPILLAGTGLELHPATKQMNIEIGQITLDKNHTAADILELWKKFGLMSFVKMYEGKPYLAIGRTYFSTNSKESILQGVSDRPYDIYFDENVAVDDLKVKMLDESLLALEAISMYPDNSMYKATIRRDPADLSKFQVINETKLNKKQVKDKMVSISDALKNIKTTANKQDKVDLSNYNVRTYHEFNASPSTLIANAKAAFTEISQTGIEGTLTLFGDFNMQSGSKARLIDKRNPEKNGVYVVSEVVTTFGTGGYRQKIQIPHRLKEE